MRTPQTQRRLSGAPAVVMAAALGLGTVGGALAYHAVASAGSPVADTPVAAVPAAPTKPAERRRTVVRWARCTPPAVLERGVCVTDVVREVVLPAPVTARVQPAVATRGTSAVRHSGAQGAPSAGDERSSGEREHDSAEAGDREDREDRHPAEHEDAEDRED